MRISYLSQDALGTYCTEELTFAAENDVMVAMNPQGSDCELAKALLAVSCANLHRWRPEATTSLQQLAAVLLGEPGLPVSIEGHTDNEGSAQHNQTLSEQRAEAVKQWLATTDRVPGDCIATKGFGASKPVISNASAAGRQKNRRVEISIQKGRPASGA